MLLTILIPKVPDRKWIFYFLMLQLAFVNSCGTPEQKEDHALWEEYRGDQGSNAYSNLTQINKETVKGLTVAWIYRTGDILSAVNLECNPIIIGSTLYGVSSGLKVFALNAATGEQLWRFDPFNGNRGLGVLRGVNYWSEGQEQRIITFAAGKMISLDARTGKPISSFGKDGYVDLNEGLPMGRSVYEGTGVGNTSPGVIYKDLIIIGSSVGEDYGSAPGHIRAYDVRTGKMRWIFHTIPQQGEPGYETWPTDGNEHVGGVNAWGGLSIDKKRGIVFAATGSPAFDFFGADRHGKNLFANSVIALNASTGKLIWYYQTTHHDLWDYDLVSAPNLITIERKNKKIDAVAQITKQGYIFLFDRETGTPLFPIEEKPVMASHMVGEQSWPTQPIPVKPLPLARQKFDTSLITDISPEANAYVLDKIKNYSYGDIYLPPSTSGIIQMPGTRGGAEWSGACVDAETGILYVGINNIPMIFQLEERDESETKELSNLSNFEAGRVLYQNNCAVCHGSNKEGNGSFPPLLDIADRMKPKEIKKLIESPGGQMPSFKSLREEDKLAIVDFLYNHGKKQMYAPDASKTKSSDKSLVKRYKLKGYNLLVDQNGYPGIKPPWGTLNAVNMNSGEILWQIPLGGIPELEKEGRPNTGSQLLGGGIVTAGGLIFIGAAKDEKFRAIDKDNGKVLWEYQLPAGGYATPSTYSLNGRQYIVIAAGGGGRQGTKPGDYYIAFALPK